MINVNSGFYQCNGMNFSSKVEAMLMGQTLNKPVSWQFHQEIFGKYLWHIEPSQTLDQLYDRRAKELREKYDYIILSFSGGSDTNNIAESFIRQNLHIDEIVTNHMSQATRSSIVLDPTVRHSWNFAAEHQLQAVPRLQSIRNRLPKTKITELDVSEPVVNSLRSFDDVDWVLNRNDHLSVGQLFRYNYFHFGSIKKKFDQGQRVAIIVGLDKPKTLIRDNEFYLYFVDTVANITTINDFNTHYNNVTTELFYWSPDCADMLCKQAHIIKRWLEANPQKQKFWINPSYETMRLHHEKWLRSLLYSTWDESWFQVNKSTDWWHTEFDNWFRSNTEFEKQMLLWRRGIDHLVQKLPNSIGYDRFGRPDRLSSFRHEYHIGPINN